MNSSLAATAATVVEFPPRQTALPPAETYLIGQRSSPHVHDYRDFLERNRVPFRWIDVDRNPLVRFLDVSAALGKKELPFFLFADGTQLDVLTGPDEESPLLGLGPSSRSAWGCMRTLGRTTMTS
jgi:hypothetical protein